MCAKKDCHGKAVFLFKMVLIETEDGSGDIKDLA